MKYKGFYIDYIGIAPGTQFNYHFIHEDEDPEDYTIGGFASSEEDAKAKIHAMILEEGL